MRAIWGRLRRYGLLAGLWTLAATLGSKIQTLAALAAAGYAGGIQASGQMGLATGTALLCATLADFGLSSFLNRAVASGEIATRRDVLAPGLRRVATAPLIAFVAYTALTGLPTTDSIQASLAVALYSAGFEASTLAIRLAYGANNFRTGASINGVVRAATIIPIFVIAAVGNSVPLLLLVMALGETTIAVLQYRVLPRSFPPGREQSRVSALTFANSWRLGIAGVANVLSNRSDVIVVALFASTVALGEYNIASQVENALTVAALIPAGATVTFTARNSNYKEQSRLGLVVSAAVIVVYTVVAFPLFVFPQSLVPLLFGVDLSDYSTVQVCIAAGYFSALAGVQLQVLVGKNRQTLVALVWAVLVPVAVATLAIGSASGGALGASWGALIRDILFFVLTLLAVIISFRADRTRGPD